MSYDVTTPVFDGPFDLLLHLILREQVELYDVSLTKIVDAYLAELESMEKLSLDVATEFLLIAATLIELKTRRLLPGDDDLDLDEELALWSERDLLLTRLVECKTFKDAAVALHALSDRAGRSFPRVAGPDERFVELTPDVLEGVTPNDLRAAFLRAVAPKPVPFIDLDHVAPIRASVTDAVVELLEELPIAGTITFRELTGVARRAARRGGAVPRRARAVQAGFRRPRPAAHVRRHPDRVARPRPLRARRAVAGRCLRWLT